MTNKELRYMSRGELLEIRIGQTGSIAEAALRLNGVFETAGRAVQQYLENVRSVTGEESGGI